MTRDDMRATIVQLIAEVAPGADASALAGDANLAEALDLDSFDLLQLAIRIRDRTGVEVPEADMGRLLTLDGCVDYVAARLG